MALSVKLDLSERLKDWSGEAIELTDEEGKVLPTDRQLTVGRVLMSLLGAYNPPVDDVIRVYQVGIKLAKSLDTGKEVTLKENELRLVREAWKANKDRSGQPIFSPLAMGPVGIKLGMSKEDKSPEE